MSEIYVVTNITTSCSSQDIRFVAELELCKTIILYCSNGIVVVMVNNYTH